MSRLVAVSGYLTRERVAGLERAHPDVTFAYAESLDELSVEVTDAEVIASAGMTSEVLARATRLLWWHSWAAGPDAQLAALTGRDLFVTCSKGNGAIPLAEHALMLMLMLNRRVTRSLAAQASHRWEHFRHGELNGRTLGIVGLGNVGADLVLKAQALHMRVLGIRRVPRPVPGVDEVRGPADLPWLLANSDVVVQTAPLTAATSQMIGAEQLRMMRPGAVFICVSRGGTYDEVALAQALVDGHLGGAGLDDFAVEPLAADSPLWQAPNTIITPHNGSSTPQSRIRAADIFVENLDRYLAGRELFNTVDLAEGY